jgi:hypothetical protein
MRDLALDATDGYLLGSTEFEKQSGLFCCLIWKAGPPRSQAGPPRSQAGPPRSLGKQRRISKLAIQGIQRCEDTENLRNIIFVTIFSVHNCTVYH